MTKRTRWISIDELRAYRGQPSLNEEYAGAALVSGAAIQYAYARCEIHGVFGPTDTLECLTCATSIGIFR